MDILWQQVIIVAVVGLSTAYLVRHYIRRRRKSGCADCPTMKTLADRRKVESS